MRIGLSSRRIDPQPGALLGGYPDARRPCIGSNDPLMLTSIWVEPAEGDGLLLVVFDGIVTSPSLVEAARRAVPTGTTVLVHASHTHSAPALTVPHWDQGVIGDPDLDYERWLGDQVAAATAEATANVATGAVRVGSAVLEGVVGANRRHPGRAGDKLVRVMEFSSRNSPPTLLVLHGCHPTVLGPSNLDSTADLGLGLRAGLRSRGYVGTVQLATGGAGDQSTRTTRKGSTFAEADRMGRFLADAAYRALHASRPQSTVTAASVSVALPVRALPTPEDATAALQTLVAQRVELIDAGADAPSLRTLDVQLLGLQHDLRRARAWGSEMPSTPIDIVAVRFGDQSVLFTPLEPFLEVATDVEDATGAWVVGYTNDYRGYLLPDAEIAFGGYELAASPFAGGSADVLHDAATRLVESL